MQKYIGLSVSLIMLALPAGIALAKDNGGDRAPTPPGLGLGIFQHMQSNLEFRLGRGEKDNNDEQDEEDTTASSRGRGGREDRDIRDKREDMMERFGTTTRNGMGRGAASTDDDDDDGATSTKGRGHGKDEFRPGLPFFLRWLFGLPGTTTIADLRAGFGASTTLSTSTPPTSPITIGFFRHFFERFGNFFGRSDD